jgi:hypothetical protein
MSLNFIKAWRNDKWYNKRVLIWRFTLVLIKINYGQIGDQTGLFYTTNPVFHTSGSGNRFVCHTGTFGNLWFFHLSRRTTVIQDLLVRRQFSLVPDNRTNVNIDAWTAVDHGFEPRSGQTKDYKIGICCFSTKHTALRRKSKDWFTLNQNNMSKWSDMSTRGLLFQRASTIKIHQTIFFSLD